MSDDALLLLFLLLILVVRRDVVLVLTLHHELPRLATTLRPPLEKGTMRLLSRIPLGRHSRHSRISPLHNGEHARFVQALLHERRLARRRLDALRDEHVRAPVPGLGELRLRLSLVLLRGRMTARSAAPTVLRVFRF